MALYSENIREDESPASDFVVSIESSEADSGGRGARLDRGNWNRGDMRVSAD